MALQVFHRAALFNHRKFHGIVHQAVRSSIQVSHMVLAAHTYIVLLSSSIDWPHEYCQRHATDADCLSTAVCLWLQYEYLWADGVKYKKPVRLSAPEYIDKLFDWIDTQVGKSSHDCTGLQAGEWQPP